ncbi:hypothetical protein [Lysinibacillus fusiformis]|uniref:hypothetical protein n=1 Tax=Lysinibacillus fusiformis TaxID=28031 RepID=UPI00301AC966
MSAWFIAQSFTSEQVDKTKQEQFRYELISPNDSNIIIFDKQSGEFWRKYIESNEGPTDWEKQSSPITK